MSKYYWESAGEVVSQIYEIEASNWNDAKIIAYKDMAVGDIIAECEPSAIVHDGDYAHIIGEYVCDNYARLGKGTWANRPDGTEYWEARAYYFSDDLDNYFDSEGNDFDDWERDEE